MRIVLEDLRIESNKAEACQTCHFLWRAIYEITESDTVHPEIRYISFDISPAEHGDRIGKGPVHGRLVPNSYIRGFNGATPTDLQFYTLPDDPPSPWQTIGLGYHIASNGLSDPCISLLRSWLDLCTTSQGKHTRCTAPSTASLPTRLIHVGTATRDPRLYLTQPHEEVRYAALSHCWGGIAPIRTLNSNIEDHFLGLPLSSLPRTFADAIAVTRAVGLQFLWIDSLCIIQNDHGDWEREAARMAHVYAGAWVTISADAATNAEEGFLGPPSRAVPGYKTIPVVVPADGDKSASEIVVHVRKRGFLAEELPFHFWSGPGEPYSKRASGRSKLSTRGWVFQERLLSPRTVHFSQHEMAWECRSVCDCECSATSARTLRTTSVVKHFLDPSEEVVLGGKEVPSGRATWRRDIVPAYTRLDLTVETDRLPALAGLAEAVGERTRERTQYLAGLWRHSLEIDLLWRTEESGKSHRLPEGSAPSWSWASVTGPVYYHEGVETAMESDQGREFGVDDVHFDSDRAPSAIIGDGCVLQLRMSFDWIGKWVVRPLNGPEDMNLSVSWDCSTSNPAMWDYDKLDEAMLDGNGQDELFFLVFGLRPSGTGPFGLVLKLESEGTYSRVGFVSGFRGEQRRQSWGSDGWHYEEPQSPDQGIQTDEQKGWEAWIREQLASPKARVRIF
ncbi:heterokaryon incompatibility protein-domain-containing protein [Immersiella caudata]|uniref:Heterokaryon incompatibility protein-domain-containing protein n=1 Tax=Immersiella caudata TaxID=314043 RepID=A0AA39X566_9PEZI|nr:heterokaryon incompatibility protein-domain-containing protein [Immersiella caudata]